MYKIIEKNDNSSWGLHIEKENRLITIDYYENSYENSIEKRISIIHNLDLLYDLFELKFIEKFEEEN